MPCWWIYDIPWTISRTILVFNVLFRFFFFDNLQACNQQILKIMQLWGFLYHQSQDCVQMDWFQWHNNSITYALMEKFKFFYCILKVFECHLFWITFENIFAHYFLSFCVNNLVYYWCEALANIINDFVIFFIFIIDGFLIHFCATLLAFKLLPFKLWLVTLMIVILLRFKLWIVFISNEIYYYQNYEEEISLKIELVIE